MDSEETFNLAAAGLRADGADLRISLEALASKLEQALPGSAHVKREGGLLGRGAKHVREILIELGSAGSGSVRYQLQAAGGRIEAYRERVSGGISIRREPLDPDAWLAALTEDLRAEAQRSAQARAALEGLLG